MKKPKYAYKDPPRFALIREYEGELKDNYRKTLRAMLQALGARVGEFVAHPDDLRTQTQATLLADAQALTEAEFVTKYKKSKNHNRFTLREEYNRLKYES